MYACMDVSNNVWKPILLAYIYNKEKHSKCDPNSFLYIYIFIYIYINDHKTILYIYI